MIAQVGDYWFLPPVPVNITLANLRKFSGLNQIDVCQFLGISQSYLSKIESGEIGLKLSLDQFLKMSKLFQVSLDQINMGFVPLNKVMKIHANEVLGLKYTQNGSTLMKTMYPFVMTLCDFLGQDKLLIELNKRKIYDWWFYNPQLVVNSNLFFDILSITSVTNHIKKMSSEFVERIVEHSISESVFGKDFELLLNKKFNKPNIFLQDLFEIIFFHKSGYFHIDMPHDRGEFKDQLLIHFMDSRPSRNEEMCSLLTNYLQELLQKLSNNSKQVKRLFYNEDIPKFHISIC